MIIANSSLQSVDQNATTDGSESDELFDIPPWMAIILSLIYFSVSICAVIGNWMVLWIVMRSQMVRNVTNLFIANLAVADIIIGAFAIPFQFQAALLQRWLLPYFMCSFCPTIQTLSLNVSIFTLVTLSVDRHRAVTQPLKPRITKSTGCVIIASIWILSLFLSIPTFLAFRVSHRVVEEDEGEDLYVLIHQRNRQMNLSISHDMMQHNQKDDMSTVHTILNRTANDRDSLSRSLHQDEETMTPFCSPSGIHMSWWRMYNNILFLLQYLLPILIISIAYIHMAVVLSTGPGIRNESRSESDRVTLSKKRVIKMLFIVIAIFAICWFPFQAYNILQEIYPSINHYKYINLIWFSCHLFAMSNSCVNPFIYAIYGEKFNRQFVERFSCCCFWAAGLAGSSGARTRSSDPLASQTTNLNGTTISMQKQIPMQLLNLNDGNKLHRNASDLHATSPERDSLISSTCSPNRSPNFDHSPVVRSHKHSKVNIIKAISRNRKKTLKDHLKVSGDSCKRETVLPDIRSSSCQETSITSCEERRHIICNSVSDHPPNGHEMDSRNSSPCSGHSERVVISLSSSHIDPSVTQVTGHSLHNRRTTNNDDTKVSYV